MSVYPTFLVVKAPQQVCRLLIVSGLFNSPKFTITHNHKTSLGVGKTPSSSLNAPNVGTTPLLLEHENPNLSRFGDSFFPMAAAMTMDPDRGLHDFCALPAVADLCGILFRGTAP